MQITIGIRDTNRELSLDVENTSDEIYTLVEETVNTDTPLKLSDKDGKTVIVPASMLAYVEIAAAETRRVGFGF